MDTLTIAWLFLGLSLLLGLLIALALFLHARSRKPLAEEENPDTPFSVGAPEKKDGKVQVYITIGQRKFYFAYRPSDEKEVQRCTTNIKRSLALMDESKYEDIIDSRYKETVENLKKLKKWTDLSDGDLAAATEIFRNYRDQVVAAKVG